MAGTILPLPPAQPPGEEAEDAWGSKWLGSFSPHTPPAVSCPQTELQDRLLRGRGIAEDCPALFPGPSSRSWEDAF